MKTIIAFMTPRNPVGLFDEMLGSSDTICLKTYGQGLTLWRRDGSAVNPAEIGTLTLEEEDTPLAQYLKEITPDGDGFSGRDSRGVSLATYTTVTQYLATTGITVSRKGIKDRA